MGSEVPVLLAALHDADAQVRHDAAVALGEASPTQELVIEGFLRLLLDPDPDTRAAAHEGLYKGAPESVHALARLLRDGTLEQRREAVVVLEWMRAKAEPAIAALHEAAVDEDESVRWWAQRALGHVARG
jgi:HEAT repeat protein